MKLFTYDEIILHALDDGWYDDAFAAPVSEKRLEVIYHVGYRDHITIDDVDYVYTGNVLGTWGFLNSFKDLRAVYAEYVDKCGNYVYHKITR